MVKDLFTLISGVLIGVGYLLEYISTQQSEASLLTNVFNDKYGDEFYLPEIG